jgi:hypothetical protein
MDDQRGAGHALKSSHYRVRVAVHDRIVCVCAVGPSIRRFRAFMSSNEAMLPVDGGSGPSRGPSRRRSWRGQSGRCLSGLSTCSDACCSDRRKYGRRYRIGWPKIKRPGSWGAAIRVSGECGWGETRTSHTLRGQRITVAPAASATAQAATRVFAGAVQLVTRCTLGSGVPAWPVPWLWAWASPTMIASAAAGRAT